MTHPWFNEQVERRVREWIVEEERRKAAEKAPRRPLIAIGGDHGAMREHVAQRVANQLGFSYWDRELLHELSKEGRMPKALVERLDERRIDKWSEAFAGFRPQARARSADYRHVLTSFVQELAAAGRAVVVGRGVRFLVKPGEAFRVHVSAPFDDRVRAIMATQSVDADEARRRIQIVDAERKDFVRELFNQDIHDLNDIDLVVNSGTLGLDTAVGVTLHAYERKFGASA